MTDRALTWLLVPVIYLAVRMLTDRLVVGAQDFGSEPIALIVVVPFAQLAILDLIRWFRGRGL